ncbi:MAG: aminoacyl-tRNA hydrolase [Elusimicrobia bacterium]|nr:aminoacyl-tRNA hydrolase [Elusimicrobiota bacterium]
MKLIVGLGNPGKKYLKTRHNIGFVVLDNFAERESLKWKKYKDIAIISLSSGFLIAKPCLFMNQSGPAIIPLIKKYNFNCEDIFVIHDDMDIEFGRVQLKKGGSSGGHNGIQSIIEALGTNEFMRLRIGIGRPPETSDPVNFVLSDFLKEELEKLDAVILRATDAIPIFIESGIQKAMNVFNRKEN